MGPLDNFSCDNYEQTRATFYSMDHQSKKMKTGQLINREKRKYSSHKIRCFYSLHDIVISSNVANNFFNMTLAVLSWWRLQTTDLIGRK